MKRVLKLTAVICSLFSVCYAEDLGYDRQSNWADEKLWEATRNMIVGSAANFFYMNGWNSAKLYCKYNDEPFTKRAIVSVSLRDAPGRNIEEGVGVMFTLPNERQAGTTFRPYNVDVIQRFVRTETKLDACFLKSKQQEQFCIQSSRDTNGIPYAVNVIHKGPYHDFHLECQNSPF